MRETREQNDRSDRRHLRVGELLPWYVNGTLDDGERRAVEEHLAVCPRCREEEQICRGSAEALRRIGEVAPSPHPVQLARMMARIDEAERQEGGGWRRIAAGFRSPGLMRWALAAQLAVILVLAGLLFRERTPTPEDTSPALFHTLSDSAASPARTFRLRVLFAEEAREREIRALLLSVRGELTAGPSPLGAYTIEIPASGDPLKIVLAHLRSRPEVRFAEPAGAAP